MFHHEFVVNNHAIWVKGEICKLEAFASICPILADQFMVSAFAMNFPTATPLQAKDLDQLHAPQVAPSQLCVGPLPLCLPHRPHQSPKHQSVRLLHFTFAMSMWCQPLSCAP